MLSQSSGHDGYKFLKSDLLIIQINVSQQGNNLSMKQNQYSITTCLPVTVKCVTFISIN